MCFLRNLHKNPQEKLKVLVMAGIATKKVGAEPGLVPRLAGGGSAPDFVSICGCLLLFCEKEEEPRKKKVR